MLPTTTTLHCLLDDSRGPSCLQCRRATASRCWREPRLASPKRRARQGSLRPQQPHVESKQIERRLPCFPSPPQLSAGLRRTLQNWTQTRRYLVRLLIAIARDPHERATLQRRDTPWPSAARFQPCRQTTQSPLIDLAWQRPVQSARRRAGGRVIHRTYPLRRA
jgi:hypothetical protein